MQSAWLTISVRSGRVFDENTLPSRQRTSPPVIQNRSSKPSKPTTRRHPTGFSKSTDTQPDRSRRKSPKSELVDKSTRSEATNDDSLEQIEKPIGTESEGESRSAVVATAKHVGDCMDVDTVYATNRPEKPPQIPTRRFSAIVTSQTQGSASESGSSSRQSENGTDVDESRDGSKDNLVIPNSTTGVRERSPLVLAPLSTTADPQSSPASTNEANSSNTPDPAAGSPTTSPGDEDPDIPANTFASKSRRESPELDAMEIDDNTEGTTSYAAHDTKARYVSPKPKQMGSLGESDFAHQAHRVNKKPAMRIDTSNNIAPSLKSRINSSSMVESPGAITTSSTPRKIPSTGSAAPSPSGRTTRISSGVLRQKSVSEILGEAPKQSSSDVLQFLSPMSTSAREAFESHTARARYADRKDREKERTKLSTVVFAKPNSDTESHRPLDLVRRDLRDVTSTTSLERDYLYTLFESKAYAAPRSTPLTGLLQRAQKTVSTTDHLIDYQEQMNCRTLKRIYQLQNANRWPLRQMQRAAEPRRHTSHWDFLLDHMKWMRTDFREERKWKLAAARGLAEWCAEFVQGDEDCREHLRVRRKNLEELPEHDRYQRLRAAGMFMSKTDLTTAPPNQPTPDLVPSMEDDSVSDGFVEDPADLLYANAPAAIFSLGPSDFSFPISKTPAADKILDELPYYQPVAPQAETIRSDLAARMDQKWSKDILPVSRFVSGKIKFHIPQPPCVYSRYDYEEDSVANEDSKLLPEQQDVALFMPENKHIRDRIHPGHSFRPPSEYPMPTQNFFESRNSSQWTVSEDDELKKIVKEYSYNWSLISSCLSSQSPFSSGAERRTPWECFERWIGLEGLPADMSKTPYFRTYHSRIEAAGRHVAAQQEAAQRQAGPNMQMLTRKRTTQPVRVERKRNQKHLAMLDAMRKLAKKRETALQKQQHAADLAAMRKVNEANQPKPPITTPAEFSRLKHERELKMAERQEIYRQQVLAQQKMQIQQRNAQLAQANGGTSSSRQLNAAPNGLPMAQGPVVSNGNGPMIVTPQGRPPSTIPNGPHGPLPAQLMGMKGMSDPQIQAMLRGGGQPQQNMRMIMQADEVRKQQAALARQNQPPYGPQANHSSPNIGHAVANTNGNNQALMAAMHANSASSPQNGMPNGTAGSPRQAYAGMTAQTLSSGHIPTISALMHDISQRHPEYTQEEVNRVATQNLQILQKQQAAAQATASASGRHTQRHHNQAAMNAAAGAANAAAAAASAQYPQRQGMMTNEQVQQYNMQLRQQQAAQDMQRRSLPGPMGMQGMSGMPLPGSMSASPVLNMARPVSQHAQTQGQMSRSATPREQSVSQGQRNGSGSNGVPQGSPRAAPQAMSQQSSQQHQQP